MTASSSTVPGTELLENRRLLSGASIQLVAGVVRLMGTPAADVISVRTVDGIVTAQVNGLIQQFPLARARNLSVDSGDGADDVSVVLYQGKVTVAGGGGNDSIEVDRVYNAFVSGDAGDDQVELKSQRSGTASGGDGNDWIVTRRTGPYNHSIWIFGGRGNDTLEGGDEINFMYGEAGDDWLSGNGGPDRIVGGDGNDSLFGAGENDWLEGSAGNDTLEGGYGFDTLEGGRGDDVYLARDNGRRDVIDEDGRREYGFDQLTADPGIDLILSSGSIEAIV